MDQRAKVSPNDRLIVALILVVALALRLWHLNAPLWFDEIVTLETHLRLPWVEMLQSYSMNHHYLHNIAAKLSMTVFGEAPWAIRLPAMLAGVALVWATWVLAFRAAGRCVAHSTALLMALSYHEIWFSQNARGYTGMALFSTIGLILFLKGIAEGRWRTWIWFAAAMAATIFTHLTGAFFFMTLGLVWLGVLAWAALRGKAGRDLVVKPFTAFLIGGVATILLYLPILPSLLGTVSGVAETSAGDPMQEYQNPLWTAYEAIRTAVGPDGGPLVTLIGFGTVILVLLGALALRRRAPLIAVVTFGHILLTVAILLAVGMRIWPRFFFTDIGLLLILIVAGARLACEGLARLTGPKLGRALFPLAVGAMALMSAGMAARNYQAPKQDMAGAYVLAESGRVPGERIYAISYSADLFQSYFKADWGKLDTPADYAAAMAEPGPITLVVAFPDRSFRSLPEMDSDLAAGRLTLTTLLPGTLGDGNILILRRAAAAESGGDG